MVTLEAVAFPDNLSIIALFTWLVHIFKVKCIFKKIINFIHDCFEDNSGNIFKNTILQIFKILIALCTYSLSILMPLLCLAILCSGIVSKQTNKQKRNQLLIYIKGRELQSGKGRDRNRSAFLLLIYSQKGHNS